jgi:hypothetical protein
VIPKATSARAVCQLLTAAMGQETCPPRLLRAAQAVVFEVFHRATMTSPRSPASSISLGYASDHLPRIITYEAWGHVNLEAATVFVRLIARAGILTITDEGPGAVRVTLPHEVLSHKRPPRLDWRKVSLCGPSTLIATLLELLDARGAFTSVKKRELQATSGLSRSALKRSLSRLEDAGVLMRDSNPNDLNLAWGPTVLSNAWQGVKRLELRIGPDGRELHFGSRMRVRLPSGRVAYLPPGCRIEQVNQTVDEVTIHNDTSPTS